MTTLQEAFDRKASEWEAYTQTPAGRLREELNYRYLQPHLPPPPATILDAGCGTGNLGLRLAAQGYTMHLLDLSEQMLAIARQKAAEMDLSRQMQFYSQDIADMDLLSSYDVVICHTLLEYTPDVTGILQKIASLLRAGSILSLVFVNRHADVLKQVLSKGDFRAAADALLSHHSPADLFGVPRRTFDSEILQTLLRQTGFIVRAEYGVRIFADYSDRWQQSLDTFHEILELEMSAASQPPFSRIGRYGQLLCVKSNNL